MTTQTIPIVIRRAAERGRTQIDWLDSAHTFSFGNYHDPRWSHFRALRVINDDVIRGGGAFGEHPHRDMEILTWVLEGGLRHGDSLGNGSTIRPGDAQIMSAGSGIRHSEANASATDDVHLLQIWIMPERRALTPRYQEHHFSEKDRQNQWRLIASPQGRDGSLTIHQDANVYATLLSPGSSVTHDVPEGRHVWLHIARGQATFADQTLDAGDAIGLSGPATVTITADSDAEALLFDLA